MRYNWLSWSLDNIKQYSGNESINQRTFQILLKRKTQFYIKYSHLQSAVLKYIKASLKWWVPFRILKSFETSVKSSFPVSKKSQDAKVTVIAVWKDCKKKRIWYRGGGSYNWGNQTPYILMMANSSSEAKTGFERKFTKSLLTCKKAPKNGISTFKIL